jgi:hypothetical protein
MHYWLPHYLGSFAQGAADGTIRWMGASVQCLYQALQLADADSPKASQSQITLESQHALWIRGSRRDN